jgi:hypothetical protein
MSDGEKGPAPVEYGQDLMGYLIGPIFLLLAIWFALGPSLLSMPEHEMQVVPTDEFSTRPMRLMMDDPPVVTMASYEMRCQECHKLFESLPETPRRLTQHQDIVLDHGLNDRCLNCHDREDRNRLAQPGTTSLAFHEAALLCATCHGTTYRDWQRGMHGRTNGHWNPDYGEQVRLSCTQCHDPHQPAFKPMTSLPGPETLRMGDPHGVTDDTPEAHNPLRLWSQENHPDLPSEEGESTPDDPPHQEAP